MYIIVDIHGVIANQNHREYLRGKVSWEEFYAKAAHDLPYINTIDLINNMSKTGYKILGVTGTPDKFRHIIINWLARYEVNIQLLLMRPNGNYEKTSLIKFKLIEDYFNGNYNNVGFIIDDGDEEAMDRFTKLGVTTLQVRNHI